MAGDMHLEQALQALVPGPVSCVQQKPDGEEILSVSFATPRRGDLDAATIRCLRKLGLSPSQPDPRRPALYERTIRAGQKEAFLSEVRGKRVASMIRIDDLNRELKMILRPGRLAGRTKRISTRWNAGRVVYTGNPLDLAMPDAGSGAAYFMPIRLVRDRPRLKLNAGDRAWVRGGRLFLDASNRLRLSTGLVDVALDDIPVDAQGMGILRNGQVVATLSEGSNRVIGRLALARLEEVRGDGEVFVAPQSDVDVNLAPPGDRATPALLPGHLEFPGRDPRAHLSSIGAQVRLLKVLTGIEQALLTPAARPAPAVRPTVPVASPPRTRQVVIAANAPLAAAHLKALGVPVKTSPGRLTLTVESGGEPLQRLVGAFSKVLAGLRKRMAICQENHANAERRRDEKGNLNPYRRKVVKLGEEGELLESEDPSPFPTVVKPEHPDADPAGKVKSPNVSKEVEEADFRRIAREYRLVRAALGRIAPDIVIPDPPEFLAE
jgi:flagellar basal body rod protein FlgC